MTFVIWRLERNIFKMKLHTLVKWKVKINIPPLFWMWECSDFDTGQLKSDPAGKVVVDLFWSLMLLFHFVLTLSLSTTEYLIMFRIMVWVNNMPTDHNSAC